MGRCLLKMWRRGAGDLLHMHEPRGEEPPGAGWINVLTDSVVNPQWDVVVNISAFHSDCMR